MSQRLENKPIAVIGAAGYVGLITAIGLAKLGHTVWCVDINDDKVESLRRGVAPFWETGLDEALADNSDLLIFTTSHAEALEHCGFVFIAVTTPSPGEGSTDAYAMHLVDSCINQLVSAGLTTDHALVMKSTVACGTQQRVESLLPPELRSVPYLSCPEFLKEGSALTDVEEPDRVVIGDSGQAAGSALETVLRGRGASNHFEHMKVESAELVKLACNGWLATQITLVNEVANLCDAVAPGLDAVEVLAKVAREDVPAGFLRAGVGYGGSCFPKDVRALLALTTEVRGSFPLLVAVIDANRIQPGRAVTKLQDRFPDLDGLPVAVLGIAFKPGTSDTRNASSIELIKQLVARGVSVRAFDPKVSAVDGDVGLPTTGWSLVPSADDCLDGATAAILVTECREFLHLSWEDYAPDLRLVVDGRNALIDPQGSLLQHGIEYDGIGRHVVGMAQHGLADEREQTTSLAQTVALALLATKSVFMGVMEAVAEVVGAEWDEVARGIALDSRIAAERVTKHDFDSAELEDALDELAAVSSQAGHRFLILEALRASAATD